MLSIYTPTFQRPGLLADCIASVEAQTVPVEHVIVHDHVGLGVGGMFADIPNHAHRVTGDLVMVLSDDNLLVDSQVAEDLLRVWDGHGCPDVVMFKGSIGQCVQPVAWEQEPVECQVDLSCFAVERQVWQEHAGDWGHRYEGDFDFIHSLWTAGYTFFWWNRLCFMAQVISRGQPEAVAA